MEQGFTRIFTLLIKTITKTGRCTSVWGHIWFEFKNFIGNNYNVIV